MSSANQSESAGESQVPAQPGRKGFVEKWASAEEAAAGRGLTILGLVLLCVVLVCALVYVTTKKPVYYVTRLSGYAYPERNTPEIVKSVALGWLLNWTNWTPASIDDVLARAKKQMTPAYLTKTEVSFDKELGKIKSNSISSIFSVTREPLVKDIAGGFEVTVIGSKTAYVGKEDISTQTVKYIVELKKCAPTRVNPEGLAVNNLKQESVEGEK